MQRRGVVAVLILILILAVGVVHAGQDSVSLWVDDRRVSVDVPPRVENGRLLVPIRSVLEAMGVPVHWEASGQVYLYTYPRHFSPVGGGDAILRNSTPKEINALGATSALTRHLADQQASSLDGQGPHVVRFELLDLRDRCRFMAPPDLTERCQGFRIAVRLYYIQFAEQSPSAAVARYERVRTDDGIREGSVRRAVQGSWYEDVLYNVLPAGSASYQREGDHEMVVYGADGWIVDSESLEAVQKVDLPDTPYLIHGSFAR